ncbi:uncharacterized protein B0H18DRAFT_1124975 [Fomitopsis serialis]|uniref:uncharacterized protein n=1 Tax=Fomitopsis serialis TaxID=139415 RepID=UPI002008748C|nr:uncharacterized protein B0H18DRAFT_1124975 [Neoantrodia serialis]KAH9915317.1 hypothetical protein B0H18DRAFT_1124975 [Neoantrodia serialis]
MFDLAGKTRSGVHAAYTRIVLTRFGVAFILLTLIHCFAQGAIQASLYVGDARALSLLENIVRTADLPASSISWLQRHGSGNYTLSLCTNLPIAEGGTESCVTVYQSGAEDWSGAVVSTKNEDLAIRDLTANMFVRRTLKVNDISASLNATGGIEGVNVTYQSTGDDHGNVLLSNQCVRSLVYADEAMGASKKEDAALLGLQFWLLILSFVGILYSSIPQILAVICTRVLSTAWAAYSIYHTRRHETLFRILFTEPDTPCNFNLFPTHFKTQMALAIANLVLNVTALLFTVYLGRLLIKNFKEYTIQRVGPPQGILRIYRLFLTIFVLLQLSVFFLVTVVGLWTTWLLNGPLLHISLHTPIYKALFIFTIVSLPPWIIMGLYAVRRELRSLMAGFLFISFIYIACWTIMFYSQVYRWTFITWMFFACMTVASFAVLVLTTVFGVLCWLNFGKGLAEYLDAEAALAKDNFTPEVFSEDQTATKPKDVLSDQNMHSFGTVKEDINWDPYDLDRAPIIVIGLQDQLTPRVEA